MVAHQEIPHHEVPIQIDQRMDAHQSNKTSEDMHSDFEKKSTRSDLPSSPSQSSTPAEDEEREDRDLEAVAPVPSNSPPYSVFTPKQKLLIAILAACGGFFSPLSANIYFPALTTLQREYNVSSTMVNLTLTSYMIFQGLAPTIFGDFADAAGRRPAYIVGFVIYVGANIGLALQKSYVALFILRCMQSSGSSATVALGTGIVADIATSAERGIWMAYVTSGPMIAPTIAPIIGGLLAQFAGWRWIFWFLVILTGVYLAIFLVIFPETGRNVVGNGSIPPQGWNMSLLNYLAHRRAQQSVRNQTERSQEAAQERKKRPFRIPNPLGTLRVIGQKDAGLLLLYNSLIYTAMYDVMTSIPYLYAEIYDFNDLQIGLSFIPFGVGAFIAPVAVGKMMDWNYRRQAKKNGFSIDKKRGDDLKDFPLERARLEVVVPMLAIGISAILCYGWVLQVETSLAAPLVLLFIIGLTLTGANCMTIMLIDYYPMSPSTATAANNLVRCLMGAAGTAVISMMIDSMGRGWCFTFVAGVLVLASPILYVLLRWGPKWRNERRLNMEREKA